MITFGTQNGTGQTSNENTVRKMSDLRTEGSYEFRPITRPNNFERPPQNDSLHIVSQMCTNNQYMCIDLYLFLHLRQLRTVSMVFMLCVGFFNRWDKEVSQNCTNV